jgi:signal transduction histidine kinase
MNISSFWNTITNIGVNEAELGREVVKVRLLNQVMFVAVTASILVLISYIITNDTTVIILSTMGNIIIEGTGLFVSYKKRHQLARFLAMVIFPTWVGVNVIVNGGGFGEASIFSTTAFCAFIIFEGQRRVQIPSVVYITAIFISTKLYVINYLPSTDLTINPYDEIITFPLVLIILGLIILLYQREIKRFETQREGFIDDLERKNEALSEVNEELEQFTYIASHDLKTPLRSINSHLDLINWHIDREDFSAVKEDIIFAKQGAKQMYALINDILEYKQLNNPNEAVSSVDLNETLSNVVHQLDVYIKEQNAEISYSLLPKIQAKTTDVMVLFQNLIENGIKYNQSDKPTVNISHLVNDEFLELRFEDNGIGIEEEYRAKVFQFFKRLHGSNEYEGTGIGLGLCRKIVQNYNGSITVDGLEKGGSVFIVRYPIGIYVRD